MFNDKNLKLTHWSMYSDNNNDKILKLTHRSMFLPTTLLCMLTIAASQGHFELSRILHSVLITMVKTAKTLSS